MCYLRDASVRNISKGVNVFKFKYILTITEFNAFHSCLGYSKQLNKCHNNSFCVQVVFSTITNVKKNDRSKINCHEGNKLLAIQNTKDFRGCRQILAFLCSWIFHALYVWQTKTIVQKSVLAADILSVFCFADFSAVPLPQLFNTWQTCISSNALFM